MREMEKGIANVFTDAKSAANRAHKEIITIEKKLLEGLVDARTSLGDRATIYARVEKEKADTLQRQADREALDREREQKRILREAQAAEDRKLAEATVAENAGDTAKAEALLEEAASTIADTPSLPAVTLPPVAAPAIAQVKGVGQKTTWKCEITSLSDFLKWVVEDITLRQHYVEPILPLLNQLARAQKEKFKIPGARAVSSTSHAFRS